MVGIKGLIRLSYSKGLTGIDYSVLPYIIRPHWQVAQTNAASSSNYQLAKVNGSLT